MSTRHTLRTGFTIKEIFNLTKIDRWFLVQNKENVDFAAELGGAPRGQACGHRRVAS